MSKTTKAACVAGALVLAGFATAAEARRYEASEESRYEDEDRAPRRQARNHASRPVRHAERSRSHEVGGRPGAWCGWWMRTQRGGGPEYNLAWNWSHWGRPSGPQVGAVVVWSHHVGEITGRASNGQWIVKSGNDGGRVRERARSVAGAVFRVG